MTLIKTTVLSETTSFSVPSVIRYFAVMLMRVSPALLPLTFTFQTFSVAIVMQVIRLCKIQVIHFDLRLVDVRSEVFPAGGGRLQGDLLFSANRQVDLGRVRKSGKFLR